ISARLSRARGGCMVRHWSVGATVLLLGGFALPFALLRARESAAWASGGDSPPPSPTVIALTHTQPPRSQRIALPDDGLPVPGPQQQQPPPPRPAPARVEAPPLVRHAVFDGATDMPPDGKSPVIQAGYQQPTNKDESVPPSPPPRPPLSQGAMLSLEV